MSVYAAMDLCRWLEELGLHCTRQSVAHALAHASNAQGEAWPSLRTLAGKAGVSLATVKRALNDLEAAGVINRTRRRRADGGDGSTVYSFGRQWDLFRTPTTAPAKRTPKPRPKPRPSLAERIEENVNAAAA